MRPAAERARDVLARLRAQSAPFGTRIDEGGRIDGDAFLPARWDLLPSDRYMFGSIQTVRGCPKHCSFCSVWRTDGQKPRQRGVDDRRRDLVVAVEQAVKAAAFRDQFEHLLLVVRREVEEPAA